MLVIVLISYASATSEPYENATPVVSQWVGGGINATFFLIGLGFVAAIFTEVSKYFR